MVSVDLRQQGAPHQQRLALLHACHLTGFRLGADHDLSLPGTTFRVERIAERTGDLGLEFAQASHGTQLLTQCLAHFHAQDLLGTVVDHGDAKTPVEDDDAGTEVGQHTGQSGIGLFQTQPGSHHLAARLFQLTHHGVEGLRESAQLVTPHVILQGPEIAFGHGTGSSLQHRQGPRHPAGQQEGGCDGREDGEQDGDGERDAEDAFESSS